MANIVPFHFGDYEVRVHVDDLGEPWWEVQDVCAVLAQYEGIHALLPQEHFSLIDMLAIAADLRNYSQAVKFTAWLSQCVVVLKRDTQSFWKLYGAIMCHAVWQDHCRTVTPHASRIHEA